MPLSNNVRPGNLVRKREKESLRLKFPNAVQAWVMEKFGMWSPYLGPPEGALSLTER